MLIPIEDNWVRRQKYGKKGKKPGFLENLPDV